MSFGKGFVKAEKKSISAFSFPLILAFLEVIQTLDLLICQGSGHFREPPRDLAPASVDEKLSTCLIIG